MPQGDDSLYHRDSGAILDRSEGVMNGLEQLFRVIESHEFSAAANVASNFKTFIRALRSDSTVEQLGALLRDAPARVKVCDRALALADDTGEEGYEHPWDTALATYLWLLAGQDAALASVAAAKIVAAPRCWWAKKMAEVVLSPGQFPLTGT